MDNPLITVFTPAYNRAYTLKNLYDSLEKQVERDFEWLVVDDGSQDDTPKLLVELEKQASFPMRYFVKPNGGKHTAINLGVKEARGEWFFIVDSDDTLPPDSLEINRRYIAQVRDDKRFGGVVGLRESPEGKPWIVWFGHEGYEQEQPKYKEKVIDADMADYRYKRNFMGDRAEVVRTALLRECPLPVFEGERFLNEDAIWYQLIRKRVLFRWFHEPTYISEYLSDGLTRNWRDTLRKSWRGVCYVNNILPDFREMPIKKRLRMCLSYYRYGRVGGVPLGKLFRESRNKLLSLVAIPYALLTPR